VFRHRIPAVASNIVHYRIIHAENQSQLGYSHVHHMIPLDVCDYAGRRYHNAMITFMKAVATLYMFIAPLIFIGLMYMYFKERNLLRRLEKFGKTTNAEVIDSGTRSSGRSYYHYLVYRFHLPETTTHYEREQTISKQTLAKRKSSVTVDYLPTNPSLSRLSGDDSDSAAQKSIVPFAFLMIVLWPFAALLLLGL
jgi:hypothetical protein